jgi:hypothetical protein
MHSSDQPDKAVSKPAPKSAFKAEGERLTFPIPLEVQLRMRREGAVAIRESDWLRFTRAVRNLDGRSSNYLAAAWAVVGISATMGVGAVTLPGHFVIFGVIALLCAVGSGGCFIAHHDVNRKRDDLAEELALEMEEAGMDLLPVIDSEPETPDGPDTAPS